VTARVHHSAIVVRDVESSLRFWRDGVGFVVTMDMHFDGDWSTLFGAPANRLRSIFLGDPACPDAGIVELVQFDEQRPEADAGTPTAGMGFFLLSCYVDLDAVLDRLRALDLGGEPRRIVVPGPGRETTAQRPEGSGARSRPIKAVGMATVVDPDGVLVELIDIPSTP
jgi:catechol 2,3-dioxygenase-like lactoylglutathione lyase family enzyme